MAMPLLACNGGGMREKYAAQALEQLYKRYEGEIEHGTEKKPIVLHVLENDTAKSSGYLKELLDGFNEKYAEYYITAVDANQDQYANLAEDGPYGYGPDVLYQANDVLMKYCAGKHIIPLPVDKLDAYSALPQLVKDTYTYNLGGNEYFMGVGVNIQAPMLYYRKDLLPENWKTEWDDNENGVPDMVEDMRAMYRFGKARHEENAENYGYMHSLNDPYFSCGYLFTYGAYVFGADNSDYNDIGFAAGDSYKGAGTILQLAESMNSGCIDDSITRARELEFAKGTYFAISNTQDMYGTLQSELIKEYTKSGMSARQARRRRKYRRCAAAEPARIGLAVEHGQRRKAVAVGRYGRCKRLCHKQLYQVPESVVGVSQLRHGIRNDVAAQRAFGRFARARGRKPRLHVSVGSRARVVRAGRANAHFDNAVHTAGGPNLDARRHGVGGFGYRPVPRRKG